jgi:hypothetical protein
MIIIPFVKLTCFLFLCKKWEAKFETRLSSRSKKKRGATNINLFVFLAFCFIPCAFKKTYVCESNIYNNNNKRWVHGGAATMRGTFFFMRTGAPQIFKLKYSVLYREQDKVVLFFFFVLTNKKRRILSSILL